MAHEKHPKADDRRRSAVAAIKGILELPIIESHRRKFLSVAIWMLTEADGKYNTRFRSAASIGKPRHALRHEHVYPREQMVSALIADPAKVDEIAAIAIGCIVTQDEHESLHFERMILRGGIDINRPGSSLLIWKLALRRILMRSSRAVATKPELFISFIENVPRPIRREMQRFLADMLQSLTEVQQCRAWN